MGIPLQRTPEGMKNTDKTGSEILGFVSVLKHSKNNTLNSVKKAIEQRTIF